MAKTQEELNALQAEYESLTNKLKELTEEELKMVTGGIFYTISAKYNEDDICLACHTGLLKFTRMHKNNIYEVYKCNNPNCGSIWYSMPDYPDPNHQ